MIIGGGFAGLHAARALSKSVRVDAVLPRQSVQLGLIRGPAVPLDSTVPATGSTTRSGPARSG
jgi:hypothetical protein